MALISPKRSLVTLVLGGVLGVTALGEVRLLQPEEVAAEFERRSWGREDGLPDSRVWAIQQTRDGYLWVGTQRGLARFDGHRFTVFNRLNTPAMASDDCQSLVEDRHANLWVSTREGLLRKTGSSFARFDLQEGLLTAHCPPLCASEGGGVWAGGFKCVARIHGEQVKIYRSETDGLLGEVCALAEDEEGDLWIGSTAGLARFNVKQERFESVNVGEPLRSRPVTALWKNPPGGIWALFAEYLPKPGESDPKIWLGCIKVGQWSMATVTNQGHFGTASGGGSFLFGDFQGRLWLSATGDGIHCYRNGEGAYMLRPEQSAGNRIVNACLDREGSLWVATSEEGLERWTPRKLMTYTTENGLVHDDAWTICEARDGSVWMGTEGGLSRYRNGRFVNFPIPAELPESSVRSIVEDRSGVIWFGTIRAIHTVQQGEFPRLTLPGDWVESKIRTLHPAHDGALWIGSVRGLSRMQAGQLTKFTTVDGLGSNEVLALLESYNGDLWVGTAGGGLSRFHQGQFTTFSTTNGLSNNNVWALYEDADGVLWIGTERGLNRLEQDRLTSFTQSDGLPDDMVTCVIGDNWGRLWIGHDRGLYWVPREHFQEVAAGRRTQVTAVRYDESDGLLSLEVNGQRSNPVACQTRDGRLWFPTTKGVVVVDPAKVGLDAIAPLPVIEEVRANGKLVFNNGLQTVDGGQGMPTELNALHFPPGGARVLEFRYTACTFTAPEKALFRYRLVGLQDHWLDAGTRREIYFADLRPGEYRFELSACNHHGVWQERSAAVAFKVAPFFYQTWWFYGVSGAGLTGLVALTVGWRVREVRRIETLERLNALNSQRKRIARDIHDELGASLTQIAQLSGHLRRYGQNPAKLDQQAERIAAIAGDAVDSIGAIVWANNPEFDTLEDLVAYLRELAAGYFAEVPTTIRFDFPETVPSWPVSGMFRRNLVMLVREALQNVSKHAGADLVSFRVALRNNRVELDLSDNGRGLPVSGAFSAGNGLSNMRQRISELQGEFEVNSQPSQGTTIRARIPLA
ncbi:MAG: two-component regulator propeller domain-containing protein [Verrucomicrobiia bacterium]